MTLSILIPVYNEKNTILEILERINKVNLNDLGFDKEIIIIDDRSTDGTTDTVKKLEGKYKIVYHSRNQGKGAAIKSGLKEVTGDYVVVQDADLEYDPEDYRKLLKCAIENNAQVVYGSRRLNPENKFSHRSYFLGGIFLSWVANIICGTKITDEATCYKLFKTNLLKSIQLEAKRFEFCPEVTAKIAKRGVKIYEVPIRYFPRHVDEGKKIRWRDGVLALWIIIKYRLPLKT